MARWDENHGLVRADVDAMKTAVIAAWRAGVPLGAALTFSPSKHLDDKDRADEFKNMNSYFDLKLKRAGHAKVPRLWFREKALIDPNDAGLHYHGVSPLYDEIEKIIAGVSPNLKVEETGGKYGAGGWFRYMNKQREAEYEAALARANANRWELEEPAVLIGPRLLRNGHLKDLINQDIDQHKIYSFPPASTAPSPRSLSVTPLVAVVEPVVVEIAVEQQQQPEQIDIERWLEEHDAAVVEQPAEPVEIASTPTTSIPAMAPDRARRRRRPAREIDHPEGQAEMFPVPNVRAMIDSIAPNNAERARLLGKAESHVRAMKSGFFRPSPEVWRKLEALAA
jgi:hypothetical protein